MELFNEIVETPNFDDLEGQNGSNIWPFGAHLSVSHAPILTSL